MTSGWYLTKRSPSHCNESYLILGGEMRIDSGETECGTRVGGVVLEKDDAIIQECSQASRDENFMTQFMNNTTGKLQSTMELAPDLAAVGVSDYVWGDGDESESVPIL